MDSQSEAGRTTAPHIELQARRILEASLVAIGRIEANQQLLALPDRHPTEFDIPGGGSAEASNRRLQPDEFIHVVTNPRGITQPLFELGSVWRKHFGRRYPAMGLFGVTELFEPAAKVELMGVAVLSRGA